MTRGFLDGERVQTMSAHVHQVHCGLWPILLLLVLVSVFGPEREWWRVMTSMLPMATAWELLVALQLMWSFRVFER